MSNEQEKIRFLIDYLNARTKEYDEGNPTISDKEWDEKYFELVALQDQSGFIFEDSPTEKVNYEVVNSLKKIAHNHPMLSLDKTKELDDIKLNYGLKPYIAMAKMDGLTCSLLYENGVLVRAETRGDGVIGEDITHNAKVIPSIPNRINYKSTLVIDGEVICTYKDFEKFSDKYKNPRNFASGSIRLLDAKECANRNLTFVAWDIIGDMESVETLSAKLDYLADLGFTCVPYSITGNVEDRIEEVQLSVEKHRYPIDGIVFKYDNCKYYQSLGQTSHHFKGGLAYKFYDDKAISYLKDIEWTMGRTGILTPVAVFEPIDMDGSIVERASLHNVSVMDSLLGTPYYGQKVEVYKANMIIPQIAWAEGDVVDANNTLISVPKVCPICGEPTKYVKSENGIENLYCSNPNCEGKIINQIDHFCGKKGLDMKGLSKATLEKLISWGWIASCSDLFTLKDHAAEWKQKPGFGEKSVENVLAAIESSKTCELNKFICAIGIPLIGSTASKELVKHFQTWKSFIDAIDTKYHFWDIPNFGIEMHNAIINFDYTEAKNIYANYLSINTEEKKEDVANTLDGVSVVITGKLQLFKNRAALQDAIEKHGGKVAGSISGKTSLLINNDVTSNSAKNVAAKKLNIPILSEEDFVKTYGIE